ncbi:22868_t:CDS:2 [Gigaspora margarita]|uniref:22868_t:CDS:1 n=1 Tax=Gigaspora margarita TaxID=4874 RepID=A0ABM8VWS1_GIGMA|nr:22868_t:CDS:2 [Gigaspora margarita]
MKNILLPQLDQAIINAGFVHILGHQSVAVRRFGNRYKSQANHYAEDLAKYKAPQGGKIMTHADLGSGTSYEQMIPLTHHADMVKLAIARGAYEIDKKFMLDICNFNNYKNGATPDKSSAIFLHPEDFYKPGLIATSFNTKRLGVIIIETMPIHRYGKHIILIAEDGYVLDIDEETIKDSEKDFKEIKASFTEEKAKE